MWLKIINHTIFSSRTNNKDFDLRESIVPPCYHNYETIKPIVLTCLFYDFTDVPHCMSTGKGDFAIREHSFINDGGAAYVVQACRQIARLVRTLPIHTHRHTHIQINKLTHQMGIQHADHSCQANVITSCKCVPSRPYSPLSVQCTCTCVCVLSHSHAPSDIPLHLRRTHFQFLNASHRLTHSHTQTQTHSM